MEMSSVTVFLSSVSDLGMCDYIYLISLCCEVWRFDDEQLCKAAAFQGYILLS